MVNGVPVSTTITIGPSASLSSIGANIPSLNGTEAQQIAKDAISSLVSLLHPVIAAAPSTNPATTAAEFMRRYQVLSQV